MKEEKANMFSKYYFIEKLNNIGSNYLKKIIIIKQQILPWINWPIIKLLNNNKKLTKNSHRYKDSII